MKTKYNYLCTLYPDHGFGAYFFVTLATIKYCLDNDIEIYTDIRTGGYAESLDVNCWNRVFEQPFGITEEESKTFEVRTNFDIIGHPNGDYGTTTPDTGYWNLHYSGGTVESRMFWRDPDFLSIHRDIVKKYAVVNKKILNRVEEFLLPYEGKSILGIHKRGRSHFISGHGNGQGHLTGMDVVVPIVEREASGYDYIFVMSDEPFLYQTFKSIYGDKVIFFDDKTQYTQHWDDLNRHQLTGDQKVELLENLMTEMLILSRCDKMLLTSSNVSHMSLLFSNKNNFKFYDDAVYYYH